MLEKALIEYMSCDSLISKDDYTIKYKITDFKKSIVTKRIKVQITLLVIFHNNTINYQDVLNTLLEDLKRNKTDKILSITCNCLVSSERGGIYLFEAISTKENRNYKSINSKFVVINSDNGTVSLGPAHIENKNITEKIQKLIEQSREIPKNLWIQEFSKIVDLCIEIAKTTKRLNKRYN